MAIVDDLDEGGERPPLANLAARQAPAGRLHQLELADRRFAEPLDLAQPLGARGDDLGEGAEARDKGLGERLHVAPRDRAKQHQF